MTDNKIPTAQDLANLLHRSLTSDNKENSAKLINNFVELIKQIPKEERNKILAEEIQFENDSKMSLIEFATLLPKNQFSQKVVETILENSDKNTYSKKQLDNALNNARKQSPYHTTMEKGIDFAVSSAGQTIGSTIGAHVGTVVGIAIPIPIMGSMIGSTLFSSIGSAIGKTVSQTANSMRKSITKENEQSQNSIISSLRKRTQEVGGRNL